MRMVVIASIVGLMTSASVDARPQAPQESAPKDTTMTLKGCISPKPAGTSGFTFVEADTGDKYRLTGKTVRKFAGQHVEIVGGPPGKGLVVKGGLWPSPNVAAQSGAIDPAQAAIAAQPGGTSAGIGPELPEFRVARVRAVSGSCE